MGFPFMPLIMQLFCCETVRLLEGLAALHPEQLNIASVGISGLPLLNIPFFDNASRRGSDFYLDDNLLPTGQPCQFTIKHIMCKLVCQDIVFLYQLITYFMVSSYLKQYMANNVILSHFLITLEIAEVLINGCNVLSLKIFRPQFLKLVTMLFSMANRIVEL